MPAVDVDAERMIETLNRHGVKYVVVGGFAVELWGVAVQPTVDVDITPERSGSNLERLADALNELKSGIRITGDSIKIPGGFTKDNLTDLVLLNLMTSAGPLDLTVMPAGTDGFEDLVQNMSELEYRSVLVPTASLVDVARSKEAAGRPKDLKTLPAILAHLDRHKKK